MKKIILFIISLMLINSMENLRAQAFIFSANEIKQNQINVDSIEQAYQAGTVVFTDSLDAYLQAYRTVVEQLADYLLAAGIEKGSEFRIFNRMYFAEDGRIEHWLFNPLDDKTPDQELIKQAMKAFSENEKFPKDAPVKFSQCSPLVIKL